MNNIITDRIAIPSLPRTYRFVHVSDLHIAHAYETDCEETRSEAARQADRWTNRYSPKEAFDQVLAHIKEYGPDAVFVTGDAVDYFSSSNISYLSKKFQELKVPVLYTMGNHEGAFGYYSGAPYTKKIYHFYKELAGENPLFYRVEMDGLILASIDDSDKKITQEQLDFMKELSAEGKPILLLCHIPLRTEHNEEKILRVWGKSFMLGTENDPDLTKEFCRFIRSEESHVAAIFAGHVHFSDTGEFAPGRLQFCAAPAFTDFIRDIEIN